MRTKPAVAPGDAERLRRSLLRERAGLLDELASLQRPALDPPDREERDSLVRLLARSLREVQDALNRLDRGTFGLCEACGRPIAAERLRALPRARLCVRCQRREDAETRGLRADRARWNVA